MGSIFGKYSVTIPVLFLGDRPFKIFLLLNCEMIKHNKGVPLQGSFANNFYACFKNKE